jgi:CheY-like chemotaxis protein
LSSTNSVKQQTELGREFSEFGMMGKRVLIVEDDPAVRAVLEEMLIELGHSVVGCATHLHEAIARVKQVDFDVVILDVMLGRVTSHPVAALLRVLGRPFIVATGYNHSRLDGDFIGAAVIDKPFRLELLANALNDTTNS